MSSMPYRTQGFASMAKTLIRMVRVGARLILKSYLRPRAYVRPVEGGFYVDSINLTTDVKNVGSDMRSALAKRGKHAYHSAGD